MKEILKTREFLIHKNNKLYGYFDGLCFKSKNLYNVANFYIRQLMTGLNKPVEKRFPTEIEVINQVKSDLIIRNNRKMAKFLKEGGNLSEFKPIEMYTDKKWFIDRFALDSLLKGTNNEDYRALPSQSAQQILKNVNDVWKSYFKLRKTEGMTGKANLPGYKDKNSRYVTFFTNQQVKLRGNKLNFPLTHLEYKLNSKDIPANSKLQYVRIIPKGDSYALEIVFKIQIEDISYKDTTNIASIDLGVENLVTLTNNLGEAPLIIKGGRLKSNNQWWNKNLTKLKEIRTKGHNSKNPKEKGYYKYTKRMTRITQKRNNQVRDYLHKASKKIIDYLVVNGIDTLIIGYNKNQKQKCNLSKKVNQQFIQIPFHKLIKMLEYKALEAGIKVIITEESYTSKASFIDEDTIPVYKENDYNVYKFSGKRIKRGLYKTKEGKIINADVNGSACIGRKGCPDLPITDKWKSGLLKNPQVIKLN